MSQNPNQRQDPYSGNGNIPQSFNPYGTPPSQLPQQYPYGTPAQASQPAYYGSVTGYGSQPNYGTPPNYGAPPNYGMPPNYQQQNYGDPYKESKTNRMNCFAHPEAIAVAQCSRCHKGMCGVCAHSTNGATLCFSCYESLLRAGIARAKRSTIGVWVFTGVITLYAAISSIYNQTGGAIILVVPLAFALSWCLFWGWMPVWKEFRKMLGGLGCIFGPALILAAITLLVAGILVAIAIPVGAMTGIKRYTDARQLAANGDQMLASLHNMPVQRIS